MNKKIALGLIILMAGLAVLIIGGRLMNGTSVRNNNWYSEHWKSHTGISTIIEIFSYTKSRGGSEYTRHNKLTFEIDGQTFTINYNEKGEGSDKIGDNREIRFFYDPDSPERTSRNTEPPYSNLLGNNMTFSGLIIICAALFSLARLIWK
jgi:hypothetical protein